jgi:hypothetical protein
MEFRQIQYQVKPIILQVSFLIFLTLFLGALSSSRLNEMGTNQTDSYGATYSTVGGNLGVPGANPFAQPQVPTNGFGSSY